MQCIALSACTTLVSVEPKLTIETRNHVLKATLGFFGLPDDPSDVINGLIHNLITLLRPILVTSRFCTPSRDALCLGEIIMVYLSRCADTNPEVRKTSVQYSIPLSLPRSVNSSFGLDIELCYSALSALEDVITTLRNSSSLLLLHIRMHHLIRQSCSTWSFHLCVYYSPRMSLLLLCFFSSSGICDKVRQSAEGVIQVVIEFITKRGRELKDTNISKVVIEFIAKRGRELKDTDISRER